MSNFLEQNQLLIFIILGVVLFILSIYLGIVLNKVKAQGNYIKEQKAKAVVEAAKRELFILESIEIISKGVIQDQCEVSEACLRIKNLKDQLPYLSVDVDLSIFDKMYAEIEQFDTLDARKELSNQNRYNQDKARFKIESEYADRIKEAAKVLLEYVLKKIRV